MKGPVDRERQYSAAGLGNVTEETRPHPPICLPAQPFAYHPSPSHPTVKGHVKSQKRPELCLLACQHTGFIQRRTQIIPRK